MEAARRRRRLRPHVARRHRLAQPLRRVVLRAVGQQLVVPHVHLRRRVGGGGRRLALALAAQLAVLPAGVAVAVGAGRLDERREVRDAGEALLLHRDLDAVARRDLRGVRAPAAANPLLELHARRPPLRAQLEPEAALVAPAEARALAARVAAERARRLLLLAQPLALRLPHLALRLAPLRALRRPLDRLLLLLLPHHRALAPLARLPHAARAAKLRHVLAEPALAALARVAALALAAPPPLLAERRAHAARAVALAAALAALPVVVVVRELARLAEELGGLPLPLADDFRHHLSAKRGCRLDWNRKKIPISYSLAVCGTVFFQVVAPHSKAVVN